MPDLTRADLIDAIEGVMVREGGRLAEWHSWRCAYPDQYGQCDCNSEVAADIAKELFPAVKAEIDALAAEVRAAGFGDPLDRWGHGLGVPSSRGRLCSSCAVPSNWQELDFGEAS